MIRIPGKIPIIIHPWFWVIALLIGFLNTTHLLGIFIWAFVILVSIIVHELGHALMARFFGKPARIDLVAFGGVTSYPSQGLSYVKQFFIVLNGPLFGFLLFLGSLYLTRFAFFQNSALLLETLRVSIFVNLFWTLVNLLPILPLDGGQLLRVFLEGIWGVKGFRASLIIGMIISIGLAFTGFIYQNFILGAIFFLFAFQSFDHFRRTKLLTSQDQSDDLRKKLLQAEDALRLHHKEEAKTLFEELHKQEAKGVIYHTATQYLAFLYFEEGRKEEAYKLLLSIKDNLANEAICLLHLLSAENNNFALTAELSSTCYELSPNQEVALRNARAFASLNQSTPSAGWLQTAWSLKHYDVQKVVQEEVFSQVAKDPKFQKLINQLHA